METWHRATWDSSTWEAGNPRGTGGRAFLASLWQLKSLQIDLQINLHKILDRKDFFFGKMFLYKLWKECFRKKFLDGNELVNGESL